MKTNKAHIQEWELNSIFFKEKQATKKKDTT